MDDIKVDPIEDMPEEEEPEEPEICAEAEVEFEVRIPQVWLLLDRSGSMDWSLTSNTGDDGERWNTLGRVLLGDSMDQSDRGVIGEFESQVSFGATFFTQTSAGGCMLDLESVPIGLENYEAISTEYEGLAPGGGTPTAEAYSALAAQAEMAEATSGPKIIILATDGEPNNCTNNGDPETNVENAVATAFNDQILTFLVFIGPDQGPAHQTHLQNIASAGLGRDPTAEYFTAQNEEKLREAFRTIVGSARGCVFDLEGEVDEDSASLGTVTLNGETLAFEDPDGWQLKSSNQIELLGAACDSIKDGSTSLDIQFPCDVFVPTVVPK